MAYGFTERLKVGQVGESAIAKWLRAKGHYVLPVYEIEKETGKGPRLFTPTGQLIAPDMLCLKAGKVIWVEAKHKTVFSWYRKTSKWVTGIDRRHYNDYCRAAAQTEVPLWMLFLHREFTPDYRDLQHGCPSECPTGLFGQDLKLLMRSESHRSDRHGHSGMVYWAEHVFHKLSDRLPD